MLSKKKAAKKAAISATVRTEDRRHRESTPHENRSGSDATSTPASTRHARNDSRHDATTTATPTAESRRDVVLTRADAVEVGRGGRGELIRSIGDHINTRLQDISFDDDLDGDVFHERRAHLMEEARLAAGLKQRDVSTVVRAYLKPVAAAANASCPAASTGALHELHTVRIAHNCNAVTCVAAFSTDRVVYGDKSGKVYLVDISLTASGTGVAVGDDADARRRRKVLLDPPMAAGVVSMAVSDTTGNRPTTRDVFEKTTVDMSCPSYVAAGAMDGSISIWETLSRAHKGLLFMHRKPITGLRFRMDTSTLYSCCEDGTLRVWSVPQMMAVDKLFGHEGAIHLLDALRKETAATVGEDATMRLWKMDAATQQAYSYLPSTATAADAGKSAGASAVAAPPVVMEAVAMLNESIVIGGARDGSIVVFDINRRKPLIVVPAAHGYGFIGDGTGLEKAAAMLEAEEEQSAISSSSPSALHQGSSQQMRGGGMRSNPNPITAVAAVPYADLVATASYDGVLRVWQVAGVGAGAVAAGRRTDDDAAAATPARRAEPQLVLVAALPVPAIITGLRFCDSGDVLYVAMSKEPRRGRWVVQSSAKNGVLVVPLTDAGRRQLRGMQGEVEHIPAQLFGIRDDDNAEGEEEEENEEEGIVGTSAEVEEDGHVALLDDDEKYLSEEEAEDNLFNVGSDGMLRFKSGAIKALSGATATSSSLTLSSSTSPAFPKGKNAKKGKADSKGSSSSLPKVLRQSAPMRDVASMTASSSEVGEIRAASGTKKKNGKKVGGTPVKKSAKASPLKKKASSLKLKKKASGA